MAELDHAFKLLFAHPRLAGDLVREFLPPAVARELDASTLEPFPAEHVSDSLHARIGDLVWRLRLRSGQTVYLLLEFQSSPDRTMALRMLVYAGLLAQGLARRGELKGGGHLPPILPVVLYNGPRPWHAAEDVAALFTAVPQAIADYGPRQRYLLLDVEQLHEPSGDDVNLAALLFRLERSRSVAETLAGLEALRRGLDRVASPELRRAFGAWLRRASRSRGSLEIAGAQEDDTMFEQAIAQLKEHLRTEAEASLLLRQLTFKFGPLDAATREKVATAPPERLATWAERLLFAPTLNEVFEVS